MDITVGIGFYSDTPHNLRECLAVEGLAQAGVLQSVDNSSTELEDRILNNRICGDRLCNEEIDKSLSSAVGMKGIWSRLFWKIILPFVLAFAQAIVWVLFVRIPTFGISLRSPNISVYVSAATFVVCLAVALWDTLRWSKEAESELKEADEIEKERRRRSEWTER